MTKSTHDRIQDRIQAFVAEIMAIVGESLRERAARERAGRRSTGRPRGKAAGAQAARGRPRARRGATPERTAVAARSGGKRSPDELQQVQDSLLEVIELNPGQRMEALGVLLKLPTRTLALPMRRLIASRHVRSSGQRRATTYFAR